MRRFRIALAQINATVGDLEGNVAKIRAGLEQARALGCRLVAFPELAVTGYPRRTCCSSRPSSRPISGRWRIW